MFGSGLVDYHGPFEFRVVAQSGSFHYMVTFHNRWFELNPEWGFVASPGAVLPIPMHVMSELMDASDIDATWSPVSSYSMAEAVLRRFKTWVIEAMEQEEEEEDLMIVVLSMFDQTEARWQEFRTDL